MAVETRTFWGGGSFGPDKWGEVQPVKPLSPTIQPDQGDTKNKITEVSDGVREFPIGVRENLSKIGLSEEKSLFTLTGQSIIDLRDKGFRLGSIWHEMHPDTESLESRRSQVVIDPKNLFASMTTESYERKMERTRGLYEKLKRRIRGSKVAELEFPDLLELLFELRSRKFTPEGNFLFMTASTAFGGKSRILVGAREGLEKITIRAWPNKPSSDMLPVLGLVPR